MITSWAVAIALTVNVQFVVPQFVMRAPIFANWSSFFLAWRVSKEKSSLTVIPLSLSFTDWYRISCFVLKERNFMITGRHFPSENAPILWACSSASFVSTGVKQLEIMFNSFSSVASHVSDKLSCTPKNNKLSLRCLSSSCDWPSRNLSFSRARLSASSRKASRSCWAVSVVGDLVLTADSLILAYWLISTCQRCGEILTVNHPLIFCTKLEWERKLFLQPLCHQQTPFHPAFFIGENPTIELKNLIGFLKAINALKLLWPLLPKTLGPVCNISLVHKNTLPLAQYSHSRFCATKPNTTTTFTIVQHNVNNVTAHWKLQNSISPKSLSNMNNYIE